MKATSTASSDPVAGEQALVISAQEGASDAFARLYDAYVGRIYRFVYFRVSDDAMAEDITSEVFMKAWESLDRYYARGAPFIAWLYRIAHNLVVDHYRNLRPTAPLETAFGQPTLSPDGTEDGPDERLERQEKMEQLRSSLQHLTEEQQQVLVLKFIEGLSTAEVAEQVGKSQGAVRALQMRALQELAKDPSLMENAL